VQRVWCDLHRTVRHVTLQGIHHLVVTQRNKVVGVISDRDAGGRHGASIRKGRIVADLMSDRVATAEPTMTVRKAANMMRGRSIGSLVATDKERVAGIVTVTDPLELLGRGLDRPVEKTKRWTLKHRAPHRKRHAAASVW